ncbi:hypothetical protein MML48_4g00003908 [Holotrichia oblita]|uniref:Uncharacterized protein n=1 Tax=Holotrichia oblita TaxID=644536 RepID=A0ACB9T6L6_HOLOL|nr:hypothetical protein MML48_4g00003908 [Holotrichia oblita]
MPGTGWYKPLLRHHRDLSERVPEADIQKWFSQIETSIKEKNYFDILEQPERVFKSDETCFMLCPKNKSVLASKGETTPPFVIYPYQRLPAPIAVSVPDEWGVGTSPNSWMKP